MTQPPKIAQAHRQADRREPPRHELMESKAEMARSASSLDAPRRQGFLKRSRERFLDRHVDADDVFLRLFSGTAYALGKVSGDLSALGRKEQAADA